MRTTEKWILIQEKCTDFAQKNGIHSMNARKHCQFNRKLEEYYVQTTVGIRVTNVQSSKIFMSDVYFLVSSII